MYLLGFGRAGAEQAIATARRNGFARTWEFRDTRS
jgi:hypothetical protein